MRRENVNDLLAFLAVAERAQLHQGGGEARGLAVGAEPHRSRPGDAARHPAAHPHHAQRGAHARPANACSRRVGRRFEEIEAEIEALSELRDKPAGTIRITAGEHAATTMLVPALTKFLPTTPTSMSRSSSTMGLTDIVAQRYDAGVRSGEQVAKDMIAVRIGPDMRMAVVGAPRISKATRAEEAAGPDRTQLHQLAPADLWRVVRLGI